MDSLVASMSSMNSPRPLTPITPPVSAHFLIWSSLMLR